MLRSSPALLGLAAIFVFTVLVVFIFDGFKSILVLNKKVDLDEEKARCIDEILGPHAVVVESEQLLRGPVTFDQDDPRLIQIIQKKFLHPPSTEPYNLKSPDNDDPSMGQSEEIRKILGEKRNGFFVECGALDGETRSNTLVFEKKFGWSGILIEADPSNFRLVLNKRRKAWSVDVCLSTQPYPNKVVFRQQFNVGKIAPPDARPDNPGMTEVQCLPLYSILLALNVTTVDYFSLDIEGFELEVLRTIPWEKVDIQTLSVEFIHGKEGKDTLKEYMATKGYSVYSEVTNPHYLANDFIFVKREMLASIKS
ncbi:protein Star-like [Oratosquilla oratoria]|uniref:protein Star-like n=1 Tax=Oratosquilla oratoria TaxID=337810 RepID=UPI003F772A7F